MHQRFSRVLAVALATATLIAGSAMSAAAQGAGACPFASDAVITQVLGPSAHAQALPSGALCVIMGVGDSQIVITHVTNAFPDGVASTPDQLLNSMQPGAVQGPLGSAQFTPIAGLGDVATFLSSTDNTSGRSGATLVVQSGTDLFTFVMANPPSNAQDLLTGLAQAVLATPSQ